MQQRLKIKTFFSANKSRHNKTLVRRQGSKFFPTKKPSFDYSNQIPTLPILGNIANQFPLLTYLGKNTALVGVQHMLPTTASLFNGLHQYLGFQKRNLFFCGKFYSSCSFVENYIHNSGIHLMPTKTPQRSSQYKEQMEESIKTMWDKVCVHLKKNPEINRIIILDEGGYCLESIPKFIPYEYEMASVEQTRFGFYNRHIDSALFPTIDVARSAAKRKLESPLIAEAIIRRLNDVIEVLHINQNKIMGVIGNGAIGHALVQHLLAKGYKVLVYDESESAFHGINHRHCYRIDNIENLIASSDIVLSCTGRDISQKADILNSIKNSTTLVSCSSQNIEFFSLIKKITQDGFFLENMDKNLSQLVYMGKNNERIGILENGFPINFDRTPLCDPPKDMALTRALLFSAIVQALLVAKKPIDGGLTINRKISYMLDPYLQQFTVNQWRGDQPIHRYNENQIDCFEDINWIKAHSAGEYIENPLILSNFNHKDQSEILTSLPISSSAR